MTRYLLAALFLIGWLALAASDPDEGRGQLPQGHACDAFPESFGCAEGWDESSRFME